MARERWVKIACQNLDPPSSDTSSRLPATRRQSGWKKQPSPSSQHLRNTTIMAPEKNLCESGVHGRCRVHVATVSAEDNKRLAAQSLRRYGGIATTLRTIASASRLAKTSACRTFRTT